MIAITLRNSWHQHAGANGISPYMIFTEREVLRTLHCIAYG